MGLRNYNRRQKIVLHDLFEAKFLFLLSLNETKTQIEMVCHSQHHDQKLLLSSNTVHIYSSRIQAENQGHSEQHTPDYLVILLSKANDDFDDIIYNDYSSHIQPHLSKTCS